MMKVLKVGNLQVRIIIKPFNERVYYHQQFSAHLLGPLHPLEVSISSSKFLTCFCPSQLKWMISLQLL
ncbi:hypothetical protein BDR04DRAFT_732257 [Suillus decipiens]|nr:hypothetical protein BDR04DRAFT_732257 [Suillus decipiens]